jgi:hypothetical protein
MSRLAHEFDALAAAIEQASPAVRTRIAATVAMAAVKAARLEDGTITEALTCLRAGEPAEAALRDRVEQVVQRLDEAHWNAEEGIASPSTSDVDAFARARAANSVWFALGVNDAENAQDAVYEAHFALKSGDRLRSIVRAELS